MYNFLNNKYFQHLIGFQLANSLINFFEGTVADAGRLLAERWHEAADAKGAAMTTTTTMPVLQIRNSNGGAWTVHAEFPDGSFEDISGFKSENEANAWIASSLQQWIDQREKKAADA